MNCLYYHYALSFDENGNNMVFVFSLFLMY